MRISVSPQQLEKEDTQQVESPLNKKKSKPLFGLMKEVTQEIRFAKTEAEL